jgi:hypothetical protein
MQASVLHNGATRGRTRASEAQSQGRKRAPASAERLPRAGLAKLTSIKHQLARENEKLLQHPFFQLCRKKAISRDHLLGIVTQMYGFSVLFERLLTRRIAQSSPGTDEHVLRVARQHLREEFGHPDLFHECLRLNGIPDKMLTQASPNTFLRALFGYLLATIQYDNEYVGNIAIMQVMETIGFHVFGATLGLMQQYDMVSTALKQHSEDDESHSQMGLELIPSFDDQTMSASQRVIRDVYHLMGFVLDDFVALGKRRRRAGRA